VMKTRLNYDLDIYAMKIVSNYQARETVNDFDVDLASLSQETISSDQLPSSSSTSNNNNGHVVNPRSCIHGIKSVISYTGHVSH
jgi:hypothetical protein